MFYTLFGIFIRIFSNSYLNIYQKVLAQKGARSSVINFYTYLGLSLISLFFIRELAFSYYLLKCILIMGFLGAAGNYFIIKALSIGELSSLAPINSYKPVVAMFLGMLFLKEVPSLAAIAGILLIIIGTYFIIITKVSPNLKAITYRVLALIFSAAEAIFIKKIILLTNISTAFLFWALSGLAFATLFMIFSKTKPIIKSYKYQFLLILSVFIMQYSTNYVFSKMNVSYALALFQLSTLLSVFLGVKIFNEKDFGRKLAGSIIMVIGAVIIILGQ